MTLARRIAVLASIYEFLVSQLLRIKLRSNYAFLHLQYLVKLLKCPILVDADILLLGTNRLIQLLN